MLKSRNKREIAKGSGFKNGIINKMWTLQGLFMTEKLTHMVKKKKIKSKPRIKM